MRVPPGRARALLFFTVASLGALVAAASCSLDLDESKIAAAGDAGGPEQPEGGDGANDDGGDGAVPGPPDASTCAKDEDCTTSHGCLKGACDLSRGACVYDVCRPKACSVAACDPKAAKCGAEKAYKYAAGKFAIGANVAARGVVVVHPWLFAQTPLGIVAFDVSDPSSSSPRSVPIVGLSFVPSKMVASGSRVYFFAAPIGPGPSRLPIGWIDVPADPFATTIEAHSVLATYTREETPASFPRGGDTALLVGPQAANFPSATVAAPVTDPITITPTPLVFTAGTAPVAVSGERLLMQAIADDTALASFGLIDGAGSTTPKNAGTTAFVDAGPVSPPQSFAQSADGAVLWALAALTRAPGDIKNPPKTRAVRAFFVLADGKATLDQGHAVDVEVYTTDLGQGANVTGPTAMLDADTAIVAAAAKENPGSATAVQFVRREPLEVEKNAGGKPRRVVLPVSLGSFVAAAGSHGIGYLVENVSDPKANANVYVFDPACAP